MRWVIHRPENGVAAVLFAVVATVMFGMGAMVIDAGALYQERRELQTGADAGALAIAQICAKDEAKCVNIASEAEKYVDTNSADLDASATATRTKVGVVGEVIVTASNQVPFNFAPIVGGDSQGRATARAKATYGYPSSVKAFPLTFSQCEFQKMLGLPYPPVIPNIIPNPIPLTKHTIYFHGTSNPDNGCYLTPSGMDSDGNFTLTGGFGKLAQSGPCVAEIQIYGPTAGWYAAGQGAAHPGAPAGSCKPSQLLDTPITVPIFDKIDTSGSECQTSTNKCYHVWGFATFQVTAIHLAGKGNIWSTPNPDPPCVGGGDARCIEGHFLSFSTVGTVGGPNGGTSVYYLTE